MSKIYSCPRCRTQNFATPGRLRKTAAVPLKCWKCGQEIKPPRRIKGNPAGNR